MKSPLNHEARRAGLRHSRLIRKHLGSLCLMRMVRAGVHLQLLAHFAAELVLRQHATNCRLKYSLRMSLHHLLGGDFLEPSRPPRMMPVDFVLQLVSGEDYLLRVNYHDVVAYIEER